MEFIPWLVARYITRKLRPYPESSPTTPCAVEVGDYLERRRRSIKSNFISPLMEIWYQGDRTKSKVQKGKNIYLSMFRFHAIECKFYCTENVHMIYGALL